MVAIRLYKARQKSTSLGSPDLPQALHEGEVLKSYIGLLIMV